MAYLLASEIHSPQHIAEVEAYVKPYVGAFKNPRAPAPEKFPLVIHATGGTTAAALELVKASGARGAVLVGFGENNSFASALHAKAELEALGLSVVVYHCPSYRDCGDVLVKARRVAEAASALIGARAVLIGAETHQVETVRRRFGWSVEVVPLTAFEAAVAEAEPDEEAEAQFGDIRVAKIAAALRRLGEGADLVAVQCFPFLMRNKVTPCLALALLNARRRTVACEGDLSAGFAMLISRRLTGYSGWIANAVYSRGDEAVFAHCTVSLDMVKSWRLMPHFESGLPHGLAGELAHQLYTAVSISPRFDKAAVGRARLERGGNFLQHACRTQAAFRFERAVKLEAEAPANHHVFMPGDVADEAADVLRLLAISVTRY
jgi:L-fucose isomerase-like protein